MAIKQYRDFSKWRTAHNLVLLDICYILYLYYLTLYFDFAPFSRIYLQENIWRGGEAK